MKIFMTIIFANFYIFTLVNFLILWVGLFTGTLGLSVILCVFLYGYLIRTEAPNLIERYKKSVGDGKAKVGKRLNAIFYYYFFAVHFAISLFSFFVLFLYKDNTNGVEFIYGMNEWFALAMYEIIPTIKNHSELAVKRNENLDELYKITMPVHHTSLIFYYFIFFVSIKYFREFSDLRIKSINLIAYESRWRFYLSILIGVSLIFALSLMLFLDDGKSSGGYTRRYWNAELNDRFYYYMLFFIQGLNYALISSTITIFFYNNYLISKRKENHYE